MNKRIVASITFAALFSQYLSAQTGNGNFQGAGGVASNETQLQMTLIVRYRSVTQTMLLKGTQPNHVGTNFFRSGTTTTSYEYWDGSYEQDIVTANVDVGSIDVEHSYTSSGLGAYAESKVSAWLSLTENEGGLGVPTSAWSTDLMQTLYELDSSPDGSGANNSYEYHQDGNSVVNSLDSTQDKVTTSAWYDQGLTSKDSSGNAFEQKTDSVQKADGSGTYNQSNNPGTPVSANNYVPPSFPTPCISSNSPFIPTDLHQDYYDPYLTHVTQSGSLDGEYTVGELLTYVTKNYPPMIQGQGPVSANSNGVEVDYEYDSELQWIDQWASEPGTAFAYFGPWQAGQVVAVAELPGDNTVNIGEASYYWQSNNALRQEFYWIEKFIYDDDPTTPDFDESTLPPEITIRHYTAGGNTCSIEDVGHPVAPATEGRIGHYEIDQLPVTVKATSINSPVPPAPRSLDPGPYSNTPKDGSVDNLISEWPGIQLTLTINLPDPLNSDPPPGLISWTADGFTVPDKTTAFTFSWTNPGVKTIGIRVGTATFNVVVDVPNVGNLSELDILLAINPVNALQIFSYSRVAESYTNQHFPETPIRDAMRHSMWNALCASDSFISLTTLQSFTTAHEWDNKWGYKLAVSPRVLVDVAPQQAFDSTMDLHNNSVGCSAVHFVGDGLGGYGPDETAILTDLANKYSGGAMYIWDGGGKESLSQGILLKSNGRKIFGGGLNP